jgi:O-6-methylguanine DNA methyltransferase
MRLEKTLETFSGKELFFEIINTPIGIVQIEATEKGVSQISFLSEKNKNDRKTNSGKTFLGHIRQSKPNDHTTKAAKQLTDYFLGKRQTFDLKLDPTGTEFQRQVWKTLTKIPFGKTWSYKDEATKLGKPTAVRAVANANGANPLPIVVPCHRVVGQNGKLVGYASGLDKKEFLLRHEGCAI